MNDRDLYLDLLKRTLTCSLWDETLYPLTMESLPSRIDRWLLEWLKRRFSARRITVAETIVVSPNDREQGCVNRLPMAHTMIGARRLDNLQMCIETVLRDGVAGDLVETGVWRGGATIFMRAVLKAHDVTDRLVWVADSFAGLPPPDPTRYPADAGLTLNGLGHLAVSLDDVQSNFARYGLLDEQVRFLQGWFRDTLPSAPIKQIAVLRLDGDLYESTMDALVNLYPKLSPGGYLIVDDYGAIPACRQAVEDYRTSQGIESDIHGIDWTGIYWRRCAEDVRG